MKIIELLNKIANREEITYRVNEHISKYVEEIKWYLNDEVEIIEEPQEHKIPEKLENRIDNSFIDFNYSERMRLTEIVNKINEILDYLEGLNNE